MPIDVRFRREGRDSAIARVVSFEGDLDNEQRARFEPIAEGTSFDVEAGMAIMPSS